MKPIFILIFSSLTLFLGGCAVSDVKEPVFTLVKEEEGYEIRDYAPMLVAEVEVSGERDRAINEGFRILADYIFGNNDGAADIAMTAPVTQQPAKGTAIPMTAPVTQQKAGDIWKVHFIMPSNYTMQTLPKPLDTRVRIFGQDAYRAAVIRFSGFGTEKTLRAREEDLRHWMGANALRPSAPALYAFYNPPWTLPFLRRNEVIIPVSK